MSGRGAGPAHEKMSARKKIKRRQRLACRRTLPELVNTTKVLILLGINVLRSAFSACRPLRSSSLRAQEEAKNMSGGAAQHLTSTHIDTGSTAVGAYMYVE